MGKSKNDIFQNKMIDKVTISQKIGVLIFFSIFAWSAIQPKDQFKAVFWASELI